MVPDNLIQLDNDQVICVPNPPIDPKAEPQPTPFLIRWLFASAMCHFLTVSNQWQVTLWTFRFVDPSYILRVKTSEEADELKEKLLAVGGTEAETKV